MAQIGASVGMVSQSLTATVDQQGNPIVSSDTTFGSSPAGYALLGQQLFGLPNATFNLTPPDVYSAIGPDNTLPYWDWSEYSDGVMTATPIYDATTQTWGITVNPGTAVSGDYCLLTTRSYLLNDDNLGLRQKAFAVISKTGTAAGTTQWNLTLNAIYYDTTNNPIGTATVGTALDTGTWSSISGFTTTGGSAIPATAHYVELQFKLAATATVTGSAAVTIKSCLLSSKIGANSSFLVTETFTSSTTWTPPTGVTSLIALVGVGSGGGGASGALATSRAATGTAAGSAMGATGGGSGASSPWFILRDVPLTAGSAITVGVGAGGAGGTAMVFVKAAGSSTQSLQNGAAGGTGGAATFGAFVSLNGGTGAVAGTAARAITLPLQGNLGGTAAVATSTYYGFAQVAAANGERGGTAAASNAGCVGANGLSGGITYSVYPYTSGLSLSTAGGTATATTTANIRVSLGAGGSATSGTAYPGPSSGSGGGASTTTAEYVGAGGNGYSVFGCGGGGGGAVAMRYNGGVNQSGTAVAGSGAAGGANSGAGGGGGGAAVFQAGETAGYDQTAISLTSGKGGNGANGFITLVYVA